MPPGERIYAVGDIHGRLDLMLAMAKAIDDDVAHRGAAQITIILLGDLVDRGPNSSGVIRAARQWARHRNLRFISGNHEEMFLDSLAEPEVLKHFLWHGGKETFASYGIDRDMINSMEPDHLIAIVSKAISSEDIAFLQSFEQSITKGDYHFVHAGIMPGVPLEMQIPEHTRWIREPFLSHRKPHEAIIVHGHSISDEPEVRSNRIGIDTGAYRTGRLTALGLEGTSRWFLQAREEQGKISAMTRSIA